MNEERLQYLFELFVEILGEELREIIREYQRGELWRITIASNAGRKPDRHILQKNGEFALDA